VIRLTLIRGDRRNSPVEGSPQAAYLLNLRRRVISLFHVIELGEHGCFAGAVVDSSNESVNRNSARETERNRNQQREEQARRSSEALDRIPEVAQDTQDSLNTAIEQPWNNGLVFLLLGARFRGVVVQFRIFSAPDADTCLA
jgi:hypothetical protein